MALTTRSLYIVFFILKISTILVLCGRQSWALIPIQTLASLYYLRRTHVFLFRFAFAFFNSVLYEMSMRGRPRKCDTDSAKKRARAEQRRNQPPTKVYIGKPMLSLWIETKETTGIKFDAAFATYLLDRLVSLVYLTND